jgi:hypothetical protein
MKRVVLSVFIASALSGCGPANLKQRAAENSMLLFSADANCENLVSTPITTRAKNAQEVLELAVTAMLPSLREAGLDATGVSLKQDGTSAELMFSVSPNSDRQLDGLSACERLNYLDALIAVLQQNPEWNIERVEFSQNGQAVKF